MSDNELAAFITLMICVTVVATTFARMWFNRGGRHRAPELTSDAIEQRLGRIEQAVDAIAIEMERVSEGQRFTTKLLADRIPDRIPAPSGRDGGRNHA
ncbi:MAG TPA: hypothetical protein VHQ45_09995 [Gemmatimonadaceae bacterium]|nr:hypothetical protein [Gemmatimonadaceae bacterium]